MNFTVDEINAAADHTIAELRYDPDAVMSTPIPNGLEPRQRAELIDHHGAVLAEIRRRGWRADDRPAHAGGICVRDRPAWARLRASIAGGGSSDPLRSIEARK